MSSIMEDAQIPLASLLWRRIRQLGVQSIMGVPGDMNLELLDYIDEIDGMVWVGNANELNAAYAADGYCRVKGCPGVLVTTMGVGELSALNGVAGAFTEHVKLIHVVGTTGLKAQENRTMIHHCLGPNPDHRVYAKMSEPARTAHCWLDIPERHPKRLIVLRKCYVDSLPVYIFVPMDFVHVLVPANLLDQSLDLKPKGNDMACEAAVDAVISRLDASKKPVIIVDALVSRFGASSVTRLLLDKLSIPTFITPMGKSIVDESMDYYCGVYNGRVSHPGIATAIEEDSDFVLDLGPCLSDSNTGAHSREIKEDLYISGRADHVKIGYTTYANVHIVEFITGLLELVPLLPWCRPHWLQISSPKPPVDSLSTRITQSWIWKLIGSLIRPNDILIAESGTAQFGFSDASFGTGVTYLTQIYFGSIGYSVPACLGAALAQLESNSSGRTVLVVGDGSLQLTAQEIGTMVKLKLPNVIKVVINNGGYTIERAIHGATKGYNDIAVWDHQMLLSALGHRNGMESSLRADTKAEFEQILLSSAYADPSSIRLVEVMMDKMDIPWRLKAQIDLINDCQKTREAGKHMLNG